MPLMYINIKTEIYCIKRNKIIKRKNKPDKVCSDCNHIKYHWSKL